MNGWSDAWGVLLALMAASGGALLPPAALSAAVGATVLAAGWTVSGRWRPDRLELWLGALLLWLAAAAALVGADPLGAKELLGSWLVALIIFAASRRGRPGGGTRAVWGAVGLAVAFAAAAEAAVMRLPRAGGLAENPNLAALLLLVAVWWVWPVVSVRWRVVAAVVTLVGLVATGSRAGVAAAAVALPIGFPTRRRWLLPVTLTVLAVAVAWRFGLHPDPYAWRRPRLWLAAARAGLEHPLVGASPGGLDEAAYRHQIPEPTAFSRWSKLPTSAECTFLVPLAEGGVPGALVMLGAGITGALALRRRRPDRWAVVGLVGAAFFLSVHDLSEVPVGLWSLAWVVGAALPRPPCRAPKPRGRLLGAVAVACLLGWATVRPALARAELWRTRLDPLPARVAAARRALELEPWSWPALKRLLAATPERGTRGPTARLLLARRLVRVHPGDPRAWRRLGVELAAWVSRIGPAPGTVAAAREAFRRTTELAPHDPWGWLAWAQLERSAGRLDRAVELVRRAVSEEPMFGRGWTFLARAELDRGRLEAARRAYTQARKIVARTRGRILDRYERALVAVPDWQLRRLDEVLR